MHKYELHVLVLSPRTISLLDLGVIYVLQKFCGSRKPLCMNLKPVPSVCCVWPLPECTTANQQAVRSVTSFTWSRGQKTIFPKLCHAIQVKCS